MLIEVTQADIDGGRKEDCRACPVYLAIRRVEPRCWEVTGTTVSFFRAGTREILLAFLGREARIFIQQFDAGIPVSPFTFNLDIPE